MNSGTSRRARDDENHGRNPARRPAASILFWCVTSAFTVIVPLVACALVGRLFIPVKMANAALEDACVEEATFSQEPGRSTTIMRDNIWSVAVASGLHAYFAKDAISINNQPNRIRIDIVYDRPVGLPGYTYPWHFEIHVDRQKF